MQLATERPACGGRRFRSRRATIAPFVAQRIWQSEPFDTELLVCRDCTLAFYRLRPDDSEMSRLYDDYRGQSYQRQRQIYESAYTAELNASLGGEHDILVRRANLGSLLDHWADLAEVATVLDYGGDRGQFIPAELEHSRRYVYEVSGVEPIEGVIPLHSIEDVLELEPDLVLCSHVLEHVADPKQVVELLRTVGNGDTLFYFELPLDSPVPDYVGQLEMDAGFLSRAKARVKSIHPVYNNYLRLRRAQIPWINPMMHEHINHFSERSLHMMPTRSGFRVEHLSTAVLDLTLGDLGVMSCLAR